jgi:hypothetical protein
MATVKIHEGTKFEVAAELEDGESIVFTVPEKIKVMRRIEMGCLWQFLTLITAGIICIFVKKARPVSWMVNFIITNKRVINIPVSPNKKNNPTESFYWKNIHKAKAYDDKQPMFSLFIKAGEDSPYPKGEQINFFVMATDNNKTRNQIVDTISGYVK